MADRAEESKAALNNYVEASGLVSALEIAEESAARLEKDGVRTTVGRRLRELLRDAEQLKDRLRSALDARTAQP